MSLYFPGALFLHLNPYFWKRFSNLGNSNIPVVVKLRSGYSTLIKFPPRSLNNPLLNIFYRLSYPHLSMMDIGEVVSSIRGSCWTIRGTLFTSSTVLAFPELTSFELDLASLSSSNGGGMCGGEIVGFFLLGPHADGDSSRGSTFFPLSLSSIFPFQETLPFEDSL